MSLSGLLLIAVLALIVLGPTRFIALAKQAGVIAGELKRATGRIQSQLEQQLQNDDSSKGAGESVKSHSAPADFEAEKLL